MVEENTWEKKVYKELKVVRLWYYRNQRESPHSLYLWISVEVIGSIFSFWFPLSSVRLPVRQSIMVAKLTVDCYFLVHTIKTRKCTSCCFSSPLILFSQYHRSNYSILSRVPYMVILKCQIHLYFRYTCFHLIINQQIFWPHEVKQAAIIRTMSRVYAYIFTGCMHQTPKVGTGL